MLYNVVYERRGIHMKNDKKVMVGLMVMAIIAVATLVTSVIALAV